MRDESLGELERAVAERPDDSVARLRLANALLRNDPVRALEALDFSRIADDRYLEARALADVLWLRRLAALEPATNVPGEHAVANLAFDGRRIVSGELGVADVETWRVARTRLAGVAEQAHPIVIASDRVFVLGVGAVLEWTSGSEFQVVKRFPGLRAVAPDGSEVLTEEDGHGYVRTVATRKALVGGCR